jgi:serpin B
MSSRAPCILVACVALLGCDPPAPRSQAAPAPAPAKVPTLAPTPAAPTADVPPEPAEPAKPPAPVATAIEPQIVRSINEFTIDLQRKLAREPGNLVVSPMSVSVALAMLHAGSEGATARELADVLHMQAPAAETQAGHAGLAARWTQPGKYVTLTAAHRLFAASTLTFKPAYLDLLRDVFAAPLEPIDFTAPAAQGTIDAWAGAPTGEFMPQGSITGATRLVVADTASFKADWLEPFDPAATAPQIFFVGDERPQVPMMRSVQRLRMAFGKAGKLRVLELPYRGGDYSLIIVLPAARDGLAAIEKTYSLEKLQSWLDAAKPVAIDLRLPRLALDTTVDLTPALDKLGATKLFNAKRADLGAMTDDKLAVSSVRHRARIAFEERTGEAAAAAIEVSVGSEPANTIPFIVDRPFLFYIRDVRSGALLFYGRVTDPRAGSEPILAGP